MVILLRVCIIRMSQVYICVSFWWLLVEYCINLHKVTSYWVILRYSVNPKVMSYIGKILNIRIG